jgi:hypothetical protein
METQRMKYDEETPLSPPDAAKARAAAGLDGADTDTIYRMIEDGRIPTVDKRWVRGKLTPFVLLADALAAPMLPPGPRANNDRPDDDKPDTPQT